jgi:hypothetical protein
MNLPGSVEGIASPIEEGSDHLVDYRSRRSCLADLLLEMGSKDPRLVLHYGDFSESTNLR